VVSVDGTDAYEEDEGEGSQILEAAVEDFPTNVISAVRSACIMRGSVAPGPALDPLSCWVKRKAEDGGWGSGGRGGEGVATGELHLSGLSSWMITPQYSPVLAAHVIAQQCARSPFSTTRMQLLPE